MFFAIFLTSTVYEKSLYCLVFKRLNMISRFARCSVAPSTIFFADKAGAITETHPPVHSRSIRAKLTTALHSDR